jgi:hypothetical protein
MSPATYDASGNPDNLREFNLTFSYTEEDTTVSSSVTDVVTHRPVEQSINLKTGSPEFAYFDYDPSWSSRALKGPNQIFTTGTNVDDFLILYFDDAAYTNDTTVDYTTFGGWVSAYDLATTATGTPNTPGFVPLTGVSGSGETADKYVAVCTNGSTTATGTTDTVHVVLGTAVNALQGGYKLSDLDVDGRTHYICHVVAPTV